MSNLWERDFKIEKIDTPKSIVESQCGFLSKKTNDLVIAKVSEYNDSIRSHTIIDSGNSLGNHYKPKKVYIQEALGEMTETNFKYEFFITSKNTPNYKYRVFFFEYGISPYPVTLVVDDEISDELEWVNYEKEYDAEEAFKDALKEILNSEKIYTVVNSLYSFAMKEIEITS